jgi:hypothetical protein
MSMSLLERKNEKTAMRKEREKKERERERDRERERTGSR